MKLSTTMPQSVAQGQTKTTAAVWAERALWATWIPLILFTVFFTSIPDVHNGMHPIRHSTTIVQCH